ncbi:MAG TPA: virulence protein RhuM/Fic/DOC family protein [Coxiellaceae bacterium]|nr:MAG: death-on-curing protein [Gammaproteobacteria bacterium RIFCSPHIGHO2_12_FULL_36_30]HLB56431.1 virulence protein RhuM/Fic/DOC family protein [Coxiellaceae bacterium]
MKKQNDTINQTVIYQSKTGSLELKTDNQFETIWLTQQQVAELFEVQKAAISKHVKNIFDCGELNHMATVSKMETVQSEGKRSIKRALEYYNLDLVLSIGYRVNSIKATHFRQWATQTLKNHIQKGYTINRHRIKKNYDEFLKSVDDVRKLLPDGFAIDKDSVLELISLFADTWLSLDSYDKDKLVSKGSTKKKVNLTAEKLNKALSELKQNLISKGEATDIFGVERSKDSIAGIIGNVMQSFGDQDVYPSIEEKSAHLLYFIIKNHPFVDGNKRSGAYAFVWFLKQAKILDLKKMTPPALTALTLLIAESAPKDKEKMVGLVCAILMKNKK